MTAIERKVGQHAGPRVHAAQVYAVGAGMHLFLIAFFTRHPSEALPDGERLQKFHLREHQTNELKNCVLLTTLYL